MSPPQPATEVSAEALDRETSSVELLWDLVFVFAVTQVTALIAARQTWLGFGQALIVLALVWWAWSAFVWAANALDADSRALRVTLLVATVLIFVAGLTIPHAFGDQAGLFVAAYMLVRALHLKLYADAARAGRAGWRAIAGFAVTVSIGMALLVVGALLGGWRRDALWTVALAIDYAGPAWLTRERLRGLQQVAVAHFADRYGDFIIICLGESIVSVGVGVTNSGHRLTAALVATATLGLLIALGLWWTYFDTIAAQARERLRVHHDPVLAAADAYSYLHLLIVAGIIIFAGGIRIVVHDRLSPPMPEPGRLAFCGGLALYLAGVAAFRLRMLGRHSPGRLVVAVALLALGGLGGGLPAWSIAAGAAVLVVGLCATEAASGARSGEPQSADDPAKQHGADGPAEPPSSAAPSGATTPEAPAEPAARVVDPSRGPG